MVSSGSGRGVKPAVNFRRPFSRSFVIVFRGVLPFLRGVFGAIGVEVSFLPGVFEAGPRGSSIALVGSSDTVGSLDESMRPTVVD